MKKSRKADHNICVVKRDQAIRRLRKEWSGQIIKYPPQWPHKYMYNSYGVVLRYRQKYKSEFRTRRVRLINNEYNKLYLNEEE